MPSEGDPAAVPDRKVSSSATTSPRASGMSVSPPRSRPRSGSQGGGTSSGAASQQPDDTYKAEPYYVGDMTREHAELMLSSYHDDVFLVRASSKPGHVAISAYRPHDLYPEPRRSRRGPQPPEYMHFLIEPADGLWKFVDSEDKRPYVTIQQMLRESPVWKAFRPIRQNRPGLAVSGNPDQEPDWAMLELELGSSAGSAGSNAPRATRSSSDSRPPRTASGTRTTLHDDVANDDYVLLQKGAGALHDLTDATDDDRGSRPSSARASGRAATPQAAEAHAPAVPRSPPRTTFSSTVSDFRGRRLAQPAPADQPCASSPPAAAPRRLTDPQTRPQFDDSRDATHATAARRASSPALAAPPSLPEDAHSAGWRSLRSASPCLESSGADSLRSLDKARLGDASASVGVPSDAADSAVDEDGSVIFVDEDADSSPVALLQEADSSPVAPLQGADSSAAPLLPPAEAAVDTQAHANTPAA
eukprot:TRINITY_DN10880_c0_g1_i1.p1 TRINITY_DN10880_c0_g1~~TRINITY_DN10880_c0_g1_i1.p1  ORF type:complete len:474 (+),score=146.69 TRINITY_DN10880_c0_g1_i1:267-1688(+)